VNRIEGPQARRGRVAEIRDLHSGDPRGSKLLFGSVGCLGLMLLLLDVVLSQHDGMRLFDENTSSPPSLGHPGRQ
jgi:hypothetical protein